MVLMPLLHPQLFPWLALPLSPLRLLQLQLLLEVPLEVHFLTYVRGLLLLELLLEASLEV